MKRRHASRNALDTETLPKMKMMLMKATGREGCLQMPRRVTLRLDLQLKFRKSSRGVYTARGNFQCFVRFSNHYATPARANAW